MLPQQARTRSRSVRIVAVAIVVAVTLLVWLPCVGNDFLEWDDLPLIVLNPRMNPPTWRNVRKRPSLEHLAKGVLDVPNWLVTRLTGRLGDRLAALARRP